MSDGWHERDEWDRSSDEEWNDAWEEQDFNTFDNRYAAGGVRFRVREARRAADRGGRPFGSDVRLRTLHRCPNVISGGRMSSLDGVERTIWRKGRAAALLAP